MISRECSCKISSKNYQAKSIIADVSKNSMFYSLFCSWSLSLLLQLSKWIAVTNCQLWWHVNICLEFPAFFEKFCYWSIFFVWDGMFLIKQVFIFLIFSERLLVGGPGLGYLSRSFRLGMTTHDLQFALKQLDNAS